MTMDNWIKIHRTSEGIDDVIDSISEVLQSMGIDLFYDNDRAIKENADLFIRLQHNDGLLGMGNDILYSVGISTDLAPYYDSIKGDGAWDLLTEEVQYKIARSAERGLEGFMGDYTEAFDEAIEL